MATALKTKVNQQDLKIYPSERLTQTDDGGGMPLGTPLTGELNELFQPISSIALSMVRFMQSWSTWAYCVQMTSRLSVRLPQSPSRLATRLSHT